VGASRGEAARLGKVGRADGGRPVVRASSRWRRAGQRDEARDRCRDGALLALASGGRVRSCDDKPAPNQLERRNARHPALRSVPAASAEDRLLTTAAIAVLAL